MKTHSLVLFIVISALASACGPRAAREASGKLTHLPSPISFHLVAEHAGPKTAEVLLPDSSVPILYESTPAMTITSVAAIGWGKSRSVTILDGQRTEHVSPTINITMTEVDALRFATLTSAHVGKSLLIMWGNDPLSAPRIREEITTGNVCWNVDSSQQDIAERHLKTLHHE